MCEGSCCSSIDTNMADNQQDSAAISFPGTEEEDMAAEPFELFICQICLDIAYKPVVLQGCGHVFCFWCVRRSMNETKPSNCPACRQAYLHFPRVCRLLHFLLQKTWPLPYQRKAIETQAMEQTTAIFSPRVLLPLSPSPASCYGTDRRRSNITAGSTCIPAAEYSHGEGEGRERQCSGYHGLDETARKLHVYPELTMEAAPAMVSVEDVACRACRRLVYRPVVINCGEVLCECCWMKGPDVAGSNPGCCCWCGSVHSKRSRARVCLALHHFLERTFPTLYSHRQLHTPTPGDKEKIQEKMADEDIEEDDRFVHVGVGCDGCGMFPIVSRNRYHCVECGEHMGYDLCESCYGFHATKNGGSNKCGLESVVEDEGSSSSSYVSPTSTVLSSCRSVNGRLDQKHSPEHEMVVVGSTQRALPSTFNAVLQFIQSQATPLQFHLQSGTISRRRRTHQQIMDDFDDYIDSLV